MGLGLSFTLLLTASSALAALDLGPAADFAVFQMGLPVTGGGNWTSSDVTINGDVAFLDTGPGGSAGTIVNGNVEGPITPAAFASRNWTVSGTYSQVPASTLIGYADTARTFSSDAVTLYGTRQPVGAINGPTTITFNPLTSFAEPGTYIANATSINLSGGDNLILDGSLLPAGSRVIVNVHDSNPTFSLSGGSQIQVAGGLTPSHVLINYVGTSAAGLSGGSAGTSIFGTFLGPNTTANFNAAASVVYGSLLVENVNLSSHITINGTPFVPEPSTYLAGALMLLPFGLGAVRKLRKAR